MIHPRRAYGAPIVVDQVLWLLNSSKPHQLALFAMSVCASLSISWMRAKAVVNSVRTQLRIWCHACSVPKSHQGYFQHMVQYVTNVLAFQCFSPLLYKVILYCQSGLIHFSGFEISISTEPLFAPKSRHPGSKPMLVIPPIALKSTLATGIRRVTSGSLSFCKT